jgi:hypothetical protein
MLRGGIKNASRVLTTEPVVLEMLSTTHLLLTIKRVLTAELDTHCGAGYVGNAFYNTPTTSPRRPFDDKQSKIMLFDDIDHQKLSRS